MSNLEDSDDTKTKSQRKKDKEVGIALITIVVVIVLSAIIMFGQGVFRSPLPDYAANAGQLTKLTDNEYRFIDDVVDNKAWWYDGSPLTHTEKERMVLGIAVIVCKEVKTNSTSTEGYRLLSSMLFSSGPNALTLAQQADAIDYFIDGSQEFC